MWTKAHAPASGKEVAGAGWGVNNPDASLISAKEGYLRPRSGKGLEGGWIPPQLTLGNSVLLELGALK